MISISGRIGEGGREPELNSGRQKAPKAESVQGTVVASQDQGSRSGHPVSIKMSPGGWREDELGRKNIVENAVKEWGD